MTTIAESSDDVHIDEVVPPTIPVRKIGDKYQTWEEACKESGIVDSDLPQTTLWRCLIFPKTAKKMSSGGIALPASATEAENTLNYIGQVVGIGELAGRNDSFKSPDYDEKAWRVDDPKSKQFVGFDINVGDWVLYGKFSGMQLTVKGVRLLIMNDDELLAKIESPDNYEVYL